MKLNDYVKFLNQIIDSNGGDLEVVYLNNNGVFSTVETISFIPEAGNYDETDNSWTPHIANKELEVNSICLN